MAAKKKSFPPELVIKFVGGGMGHPYFSGTVPEAAGYLELKDGDSVAIYKLDSVKVMRVTRELTDE